MTPGRSVAAWVGQGAGALMGASIRIYQVAISPLLGPHCRFTPTCSEYARQSIAAHGPVRGLSLAARRILRCHPFHPGGIDTVPVKATDRARWNAEGERC